MVPELKKDHISEGQLAREMGWAVNAKDFWKRAINDDGDGGEQPICGGTSVLPQKFGGTSCGGQQRAGSSIRWHGMNGKQPGMSTSRLQHHE